MTKAHYGAVYLLGQGSQSNCTKYDTLVSCFLDTALQAGRGGAQLGLRSCCYQSMYHVGVRGSFLVSNHGSAGCLCSLGGWPFGLDDVHHQGLESHEKRSKSLPWAVMDTGSPMNIASAGDLEASQAVPVTPLGSLRR